MRRTIGLSVILMLVGLLAPMKATPVAWALERVSNPFAEDCDALMCAWTENGEDGCYVTGDRIYTPACVATCYDGEWILECA